MRPTRRALPSCKSLITYLRAALPQMRQASSTLGRELKLVRAYLELLKLRIEERLEFDIKVPPELESAVFPPMVLQTLVENAIKHGIEPKPQGGRVSVLAEVIDGALRVDVVDTGVGLPNGDIFSSTASGSGLGLDNIRNRLALLYPGTSRMALSSGRDGGTVVRLSIPYQREELRDMARGMVPDMGRDMAPDVSRDVSRGGQREGQPSESRTGSQPDGQPR